jgi:hypothetical protein
MAPPGGVHQRSNFSVRISLEQYDYPHDNVLEIKAISALR